jgi:hypothetical protein
MPNFDMFLTDFHALALPKAFVCDAAGRELALDAALDTLKGPKLQVKIRATSSGKFINGRVYPGPRVMDSTGTWTAPYAKPVLDNHPSRSLFGGASAEPKVLGRCTDATYTRTSDKSVWMNDWRTPLPGSSEGTGFITLDTEVSEEGAVRAILDGRMLTVSQGSRPSNFFCSICKKDWMADGPCEHEPGKEYEIDTKERKGKFRAFGVTGNLDYDHIAFVNTPADSTAQTLNVAVLGDSANHPLIQSITSDRIPECELLSFVLTDAAGTASLEMQIGDAVVQPSVSNTVTVTVPTTLPKLEAVADLEDEVGMHKEIVMGDENTPAEGQPAETPKPAETPAEAPAETPAAPAEAPAAAPAEGEAAGEAEGAPPAVTTDTSNNWTMPDPEDGHTHKLTALDADGNGAVGKAKGHSHEVRDGRVLPVTSDSGVSRHPGTYFYDSKGIFHITMTDETDECPDGCELPPEQWWSADELEAWTMSAMEDLEEEWQLFKDELIKDAPLSSAQRKRVPDRLFAGPNRSFPVPDKARVRNALDRLGQGYPKNVSDATRSLILSCVKKRATTLGVSVEDSGTAAQEGATTMPNTEIADSISPTVLNTLSAEIDTLKAEKTRLESTIDDQNAELTALREQVDTLTEGKRKQFADRVVDLMLMLGKPQARESNTPEKLQALRDETAKRELVSLTDTARDLQLELAQGNGSGIRPGLQTEPITSEVGGRGAAPTADSGNSADKSKTPSLKEKLKARLQGK